MPRKPPAAPEIDVREIDRHMRELSELLAAADKYEACGYDCADERAAAQYYYERLQKVKDHIIEGKPVAPGG